MGLARIAVWLHLAEQSRFAEPAVNKPAVNLTSNLSMDIL